MAQVKKLWPYEIVALLAVTKKIAPGEELVKKLVSNAGLTTTASRFTRHHL